MVFLPHPLPTGGPKSGHSTFLAFACVHYPFLTGKGASDVRNQGILGPSPSVRACVPPHSAPARRFPGLTDCTSGMVLAIDTEKRNNAVQASVDDVAHKWQRTEEGAAVLGGLL